MRLVAFGLMAGTLWSLIPGHDMIPMPIDLLPLAIDGGVTGVAMTFAVVDLFRWCGHGMLPVLGATMVSPTLGGSPFGLLIGCTPWFRQDFSISKELGHHFSFIFTLYYGMYRVFLAWLVLPLAFLTTMLLRRLVTDHATRQRMSGRSSQRASFFAN